MQVKQSNKSCHTMTKRNIWETTQTRTNRTFIRICINNHRTESRKL